MSVKFILSDQVFQAVVQVLAKRPYDEVNGIIEAIKQDVKTNSDTLVISERVVDPTPAPKIEEVKE